MSAPVVSCECGARIRVPPDAAGRAVRCPRCKSRIEAPATASAPQVATVASPSGQEVECPICQTGIAAGEPRVDCDKCQQGHHQDCWNEVGGCSTYGCENAPSPDDDKASSAPLSAWGDTKKCPACGETIKSIAIRCRYCQTEFDSVDPLTVADLRRQAGRQASHDFAKKAIVAIFVLSILGVLAPIMLMVAILYVLRNRERLAKAGPLFVIMGWASIILSTIYTFLMLVFLLLAD